MELNWETQTERERESEREGGGLIMATGGGVRGRREQLRGPLMQSKRGWDGENNTRGKQSGRKASRKVVEGVWYSGRRRRPGVGLRAEAFLPRLCSMPLVFCVWTAAPAQREPCVRGPVWSQRCRERRTTGGAERTFTSHVIKLRQQDGGEAALPPTAGWPLHREHNTQITHHKRQEDASYRLSWPFVQINLIKL